MSRLAFFACCAAFFIGCGSQVEEVPPLEEAGPVMSQEEQEKRMRESMERGGSAGRYRPSSQGQ